jgi:putative acetyltransferase
MDIILRQETEHDREKVYKLTARAFGQESESKLVERLRLGDSFVRELSIVAEVDGDIVGHLLFSNILIEGPTEQYESLALAPMAVDPMLQRRGIGTRLVEYGLEKSRALGFSSVIVLGHKDYYPRFGFTRASAWGIRCPFEVPDEAFMAIELVPGSLIDKAGVVVYPEEFDEVG